MNFGGLLKNMEITELLDKVNTREDLIEFLHQLENDNRNNEEQWENVTIQDYLESISGWIEDMDGAYFNMNLDVPHNINWNFIALLFYMGKIYE